MDFWPTITIISLLIGIVSSLVTITSIFVDVSKLPHKHKILLISLSLAIIFLVGAAASYIYHPNSLVNSPKTPLPTPTLTSISTTGTLTPIPTLSPTEAPTTPPTLQPTETSTIPPLSTPGVATRAPSGSITLTSQYSDPIRITITKIVLQPQQSTMVWTVTLQNVSPNNANIDFRQFYLQEGDPPTTGAIEYPATGGAVDNTVSLNPSGQPGAIQTTTLTFLFMPYAISYTLTSILDPCQGFCDPIPLNPAVIPFN